jgi:hypothetical protein
MVSPLIVSFKNGKDIPIDSTPIITQGFTRQTAKAHRVYAATYPPSNNHYFPENIAVEANKDILIFLISQRAVGSEGHRRRGNQTRLNQTKK